MLPPFKRQDLKIKKMRYGIPENYQLLSARIHSQLSLSTLYYCGANKQRGQSRIQFLIGRGGCFSVR